LLHRREPNGGVLAYCAPHLGRYGCNRGNDLKLWSARTDRATDQDLATDLQLRGGILGALLAGPYRGTAWAEIERLSPVMHRRRVRFADLPQQIA
jgi:hypothetical protein